MANSLKKKKSLQKLGRCGRCKEALSENMLWELSFLRINCQKIGFQKKRKKLLMPKVLASSVNFELVSSSARVTAVKSDKAFRQRPGSIDWTPGIPRIKRLGGHYVSQCQVLYTFGDSKMERSVSIPISSIDVHPWNLHQLSQYLHPA